MPLYKNVLLVGAGGSLGAPVLAAFKARPDYNVTILSRHDSSAVYPADVPVLRANYVSLNSLMAAFKGQDAVIIINAGYPFTTQLLFIDAAIRMGVKRFIPNEFGPNSLNKELVKHQDVLLPSRLAVVDYLKYKEGAGDGKLSWTSVICGGFFDWWLYTGYLGFDLKNRSAELVDGGSSVATFTTLPALGEAVVKILDHAVETRNQYVFTSSFEISTQDLLSVIEKVDGKKWKVQNITSEEVLADGRKRMNNGDFEGYMQLTRGAAFGKLGLGLNNESKYWNEQLGLNTKEDINDAVTELLRSQGLLSS
ncbi:isoflavone reductase [Stagonosporopsis vannaccii]|nr:isoflavone reductase [Stagonosporopsis vannaccii]